jgi:hypothetical protein
MLNFGLEKNYIMKYKRELIIVILLLSIVSCKKDELGYKDKIEVAGVIRRVEPNSWYVIDDSGHKPIGIRNITEDNDKVTIYYDFNASKVHTFTITPDETFSRLGLRCGASVGLDKATIYISKIEDGNVVSVDPTTISNSGGNFWIYGLFSK